MAFNALFLFFKNHQLCKLYFLLPASLLAVTLVLVPRPRLCHLSLKGHCIQVQASMRCTTPHILQPYRIQTLHCGDTVHGTASNTSAVVLLIGSRSKGGVGPEPVLVLWLCMHDWINRWKGTQAWEIVSWCGVTPFKADVYWTEVVQQTFEVHDMSYRGGGAGDLKGNLHHWNFQKMYDWMPQVSSSHYSAGVPVVHTQYL